MYRVIIVDDQAIVRSGLQLFIEQGGKSKVVATAENGKEFLDILDKYDADVVLMDIVMPVMDGIEAARHAIKKNPDLKILASSSHGDEANYYKMVHAGVKGFVLKGSKPEEINEAIEAVASGNSWFSRELLKAVVAGFSNTAEDVTFTDLEGKAMRLICEGLNDEQIASELKVKPEKVLQIKDNLLQKTSCPNTASLIMYAIKQEIIII